MTEDIQEAARVKRSWGITLYSVYVQKYFIFLRMPLKSVFGRCKDSCVTSERIIAVVFVETELFAEAVEGVFFLPGRVNRRQPVF